MEIQCPVCGRTNRGADECPRCGCELRILRKIVASAKKELFIGIEKLKGGDGLAALEHAKSSWRLKRSAQAARLAFMACMLTKRYEEATAWYRRAKGVVYYAYSRPVQSK